MQVADRIRFLEVLGLRSLIVCWLRVMGHAQFLEETSGPSHIGLSQQGSFLLQSQPENLSLSSLLGQSYIKLTVIAGMSDHLCHIT